MHLKIGDFGLAARITKQNPDRRTMCGTPNYVAPEVASHKSHSFPADIFSCGVILYTILTGKPPFQVILYFTFYIFLFSYILSIIVKK